ncbi:hypothetical protein LIA77_06714 [Sarocladium implicatum]|nr:hypothetical protein LIA77_06714 [Sarocladium implicatum]
MKSSTFAAIAAMAFLPISLAQSSSVDPGPSPTASVGCEPHGDHWHCEGPKETGAAEPSATSDDHDHDHDHDDDAAAEAGPSPTESVGCEPHGDHWHCEGPKETASAAEASSTSDDAAAEAGPSPTESVGCEPHGDHWHCEGPKETSSADHDDDAAAEAGPSPTESVGCEPHGDHWHCDGPRETVSAPSSTTPGSDGSDEPEQTGAAAAMMAPLAGAIAVAAFIV